MTTTFIAVLQDAATAAGQGDVTRNAQLAADLTRYVNQEVRLAWEFAWWPRITLTEQRRYRAAYDSGTAYTASTLTAPVEVWHPGARAYYQCLQAATGQAPATSVNGTWTTNAAYWADCASAYAGNDWATATAYAVGDTVRSPDNGRFYRCFVAHTSGASLDGTKFAPLTPFQPSLALAQSGQTVIGSVRWVSRNDPRVTPRNVQPVPFRLSSVGIEVESSVWVPEPFVTFKLERPVFTTTPWSATTTYAAGQLVYAPAAGECYQAVQASTNQAVTNPAYWTPVVFPDWLSDAVATAAAGRLLLDMQQESRAAFVLKRAGEFLGQARSRELPMQEQHEKPVVRVRA